MSAASCRLNDLVANQVEAMARTWNESSAEFPEFTRSYSPCEQKQNEGLLSEQLGWLTGALEAKGSAGRQEEISKEAGVRLKTAGRVIFELTDAQVNTMEDEGIPAISSQFFQAARRFDSGISTADIFQASRNVWTMNYLQVLLNLPVRLSPSVFAYSMLYPVSDNYLDDPSIPHAEKKAFNTRFTGWLRGESARPTNGHEFKVRGLVQMIEGEYTRNDYPQVFESLLAIHDAQQKSLMQQAGRTMTSEDALRIAIEKGGASVLADAILVAGNLPEWQMEIAFNYGVFAQFMDDQEDVSADLQQKAASVFTEAARRGRIDQTMNRLFSFSRTVLKDLRRFDHPRSRPLMEISLKGIDLLLMDACARTSRYYSRGYLAKLEQSFPFRFKYLAEIRKRVDSKKPLLDRFMNGLVSSTPYQIPEWVPALAFN